MAPIESKNLANPKKTLMDFDFIKACDLMFTTLNIRHHIRRVVNCNGIIYGVFMKDKIILNIGLHPSPSSIVTSLLKNKRLK
jgi:hypothetical protein